jgi:hypothetical protein
MSESCARVGAMGAKSKSNPALPCGKALPVQCVPIHLERREGQLGGREAPGDAVPRVTLNQHGSGGSGVPPVLLRR